MRMLPFTLLILSACEIGTDTLEPYYKDWSPPSISGISPDEETGNLGGGTATIQGSGFGTDAKTVVVQFGDHTAQILSVSDSEIVVTVPQGPMTGGDVRVRVATPTGYADDTYTYEVGVSDEQIAYIQLNNYFHSCMAGRSTDLSTSCGWGWMGGSGLDGMAESLSFAYPRLQASTQGYMGGQSFGNGEWQILRPGMSSYAFATEDLRVPLGDKITITNPKQDGEELCVDLDGSATYYYGGGGANGLSPQSLSTGNPTEAGCDEDDVVSYDASKVEMCQRDNIYGVPTNVYEPDWPVPEDFFKTSRNYDEPVDIVLEAPGAGLDEVELTLPEPLMISNTKGLNNDDDPTTAGAGEAWAGAFSLIEHCFADSGDAEKLDDVALQFTWSPSDAELSESDEIQDSRTFVRMNIKVLAYGWLGGVDYPFEAVIQVDDKHNYDRDAKVSVLDVPSSVLYQIPTTVLPNPQSGYWTSTAQDGILWVEFQRVTEYTLKGSSNQTVVFQYVTGDVSYFLDWKNPTDNGCQDCLDGDDDGWVDEADPDCADGTATDEAGFGTTACNDGIDNDGDGVTDSEDAECGSAEDNDESNCNDSKDNDGDGLRDEDDDECAAGGYESEAPPCINTSDDDADGWVDADDPDCVSGSDELGYGPTACNDGLDSDGDGLVDADDAECADATDGDESNCDDAVDNDADGVTDMDDADCVAGGYESTPVTVAQCADGIDNDGDSLVDLEDAGCADASDDDENDG